MAAPPPRSWCAFPGEAASVVTCIDGYEMARQGRAGPALMIAAVGSFIGGTVSILGLMFITPPLAKVMIAIGPSVEVVLILLALGVITAVSGGSRVKTAAMVVLGLALGTIGLDNLTGVPRFTFGQRRAGRRPLLHRARHRPVRRVGNPDQPGERPRPSRRSTRSSRPGAALEGPARIRAGGRRAARSSASSSGIIPGVSHVVSTFVSYAIEKKLSKHPEQFGKGAIAGVAGPETANNAVTGTAMIPLLALGIPSIPATAILLSALTIHGVQPGPLLLTDHPEVFWSLVASMYIGNVILLILNLPLVGIFVNLLRIPYAWLVPIILIISIIGVYSVNFSTADIWIMVISGGARLCAAQVRLRDGAAAAGAGARRPPGGELPARAHHVRAATTRPSPTQASVIVLTSALGILLAVQALAWAFGYRKAIADEADGS